MKNTMLAIGMTVALFASTAYIQPAHVGALTSGQKAVCEAIGSPNCKTDPTGAKSPEKTVQDAINLFSVIIGIISVVMIMIGGLKYITSSGDSSKVTSAKNTIVYAIIGLIIVALSQTIVKFVISKLV